MSRPITWQNVGSTASIADANSALLGASRLFNSGFDSINNVVKQAQATDEANWNQAKVNNTEAFYNAIASRYATPEAYQAAVASGDVAREMAQYGAQIDQANARKFMENQLGTLQNRALATINYNNAQEQQSTLPDREALKVAIANGDETKIKELTTKLEGKQGSGDLAMSAAENLRKLTEFQQKNITFGQQQQTFEHQTQLWPGQVTAQDDAHKLSEAHRKVYEAEAAAKLAEPGVKAAKEAKERTEAALKNFKETNVYGSKFSPDPNVNHGYISTEIKDKIGKASPEAAEKLTKLFAENPTVIAEDESGNKVSLPVTASVVSRAMSLVESGASKGYIWDTKGYGEDYLTKVMAKVQDLMTAGAKDPKADSMLKDFAAYNQLNANQIRGTIPTATGTPATASPAPAAPANVVAAIEKAAEKVAPPPEAPGVQGAIGKPGLPYRDAAAAHAMTSLFGGPKIVAPPVGRDTPATLADIRNNAKNGLGVTNAPVEQPKVSVPVATNIGKASVPVKASDTVAFAPDGTQTPAPPVKLTKAEANTLKDTRTVVEAYKGAIPEGKGTKVLVTLVGDGDTFNFTPSDPNQKVPGAVSNVCRFDVIDAPETAHPSVGKKGQAYGAEAGEYLRKMIENKEVTIRVTDQAKRKDTDKTRNLCQVEIEGKAVDLEMVKAGFAMVYDQYISKDNPRFGALKDAENKARTNQLGMFNGGGYAQPPSDFRRVQNLLSK